MGNKRFLGDYFSFLVDSNLLKSFFLLCFLTIIMGLLPTLTNLINKSILDNIVEYTTVSPSGTLLSGIGILIAALLMLNVISVICTTIVSTKRSVLAETTKNKVTLDVFNKLNRIDYCNFENNDVMNTIFVAQSQTSSPYELLSLSLTILQGSITLLSSVLLIVTRNYIILFLAVLTIIPNFVYQFHYQKKQYGVMLRMSQGYRRIQYYKNLLSSSIWIRELRSYAAHTKVFRLLASLIQKYSSVQIRLNKQNIKNSALINLFSGVFYWAFYLYLMYCVINRKYSIGEYTLFLSSFNLIQNSLKQVMMNITQLTKNILYTEKFIKLMQLKEMGNLTNGVRIHAFNDSIVLNNVSFSYPDATGKAIKNVSMKIKKGKKIGFVGENGSGKSTMIKLLQGYYDRFDGEIIIDNSDIRMLNKNDYHSLFGYVMQDFGCYNFSVRNNVKFFSRADDGEIGKAASVCGIHEYLASLDAGYSTILGNEHKKGAGLSGGQWQKVAIARAVLKNPPVFIFDEIDSTLDSISASTINDALNTADSDKTVILSSHNFSGFKDLDEIFVFHDGSIAEHGTHAELMNNKAAYYGLYTSKYGIGSYATI